VRNAPPRRAMVRDHRLSPRRFPPSITTPIGPLPVIVTRRSGGSLRRTADHLRHRRCWDWSPSSLRPSSPGRWLASSAASDCRAGPTDAAPSAGARSVEPPSCAARGEGPGRPRGQPTSRRVEEAYGLFRLDANLDESCGRRFASHVPRWRSDGPEGHCGPGPRSEESGRLEEARWPRSSRGNRARAWHRRFRGVTLSCGRHGGVQSGAALPRLGCPPILKARSYRVSFTNRPCHLARRAPRSSRGDV
jgi:hypothetical protein